MATPPRVVRVTPVNDDAAATTPPALADLLEVLDLDEVGRADINVTASLGEDGGAGSGPTICRASAGFMKKNGGSRSGSAPISRAWAA